MIKLQWGKVPTVNSSDKLNSVSAYWTKKINNVHSKYFIDKITWNDLSMDEVFKRINATFSSVGAEYLYAKLHEPGFDLDKISDFGCVIQDMNDNGGLRERISFILAKLGKKDYNNVPEFIFSPEEKRLKNIFLFQVLAVLPIISILIMVINFRYAVYMLIVISIINGLVYYKNKLEVASQLESIEYITSIIICSREMSKIKDDTIKLQIDRISELFCAFKKIIGFGNIVLSKPVGDMGFLLEYIKILFMTDFTSYNRILNIICKHREMFHQLWLEIGKLDAAISVASYRNSVKYYSTPVFYESNDIIAENMYHPLVNNPVSNPVTLTMDSIITGSNASGKSTYVKAVAINSIFAQTIYTCTARSFSLKPSLVITSMAVNDNVIEGDSYFVSEIKSLKRILNTINEEIRCLCFIDEILKGTNTIERIAASAATLKWLSGQNCLCIAASHDIELTDILKNLYHNFHFREQITDNGINFDYKIYKGRTTTRNAIKLLEFMQYPNDIIFDAQSFSAYFENNQRWLDLN